MTNSGDFPMRAEDFGAQLDMGSLSPEVRQELVSQLGFDLADEIISDLQKTGRAMMAAVPDEEITIEAAVVFGRFLAYLAASKFARRAEGDPPS